MKITPIESEEDYTHGLKRIEELWNAPVGSPEGDELDQLLATVDAYEQAHHPMEALGRDASDAVVAERHIREFRRLSGRGDSRGYKFNRDDLYGRR